MIETIDKREITEESEFVEPYLWVIETFSHYFSPLEERVEPYLWVIETGINQSDCVVGSEASWTVPMSDWNSNSIPVCIWNSEKLNRTYEWYVAFAELIVLYEYYELFR